MSWMRCGRQAKLDWFQGCSIYRSCIGCLILHQLVLFFFVGEYFYCVVRPLLKDRSLIIVVKTAKNVSRGQSNSIWSRSAFSYGGKK